MKGLEVNGFLFEEINECQEKTLNKAFERSGSWSVKGRQPQPIILATCNPSPNWIKERVYDKWKLGELPANYCYIPAKITDNPYLSEAYKENLKNLPKYEYMVFVDGDWDVQLKTGGEFFKGFEIDKHVEQLEIYSDQSYHISIDENVNPYITISIWQLIKRGEGYDINQVHELPCKDPDNTATKSAKVLSEYLTRQNNKQSVFIYGDRNTQNGNTIDDDKKSFLDKFCAELGKRHSYQLRVWTKNPSVQMTGEFINAIYEYEYAGLRIRINESCKVSIADYINVKQDVDGSMAKPKVTDPKTKVRYEPYGHCFVGETMVLTHRGQVRIDSVNVGDFALTRNGYKKITKVFNNGLKEVKTYSIGNNQLKCTPDHLIYVDEKFIPASLISKGIFCIFDEYKNKICKKRLSVITVIDSPDTHIQRTEAKECILADGLMVLKKDYTDINTSWLMVKLKKAITYTILMATHLTTILKTLKKYPQTNIYLNIKKIFQKNKKNQDCNHFLIKQYQHLKSGIVQKKVKSGTKNTQKNLFSCQKKLENVEIAELNLKRPSKDRLYVQKNAPTNIRQGDTGKELRIVYDIEVEGDHEYFANNILVHNCSDAKRYIICMAFKKEFNQWQNRFNTEFIVGKRERYLDRSRKSLIR